jgi:hypothetical protein
MDDGIERIDDADVQAQLRRQARQVYVKALAAAAVLTFLCLSIPMR